MNLWHALFLALVQGLTEYLPISSSAHLILVPKFTDWPDQGLAFDVVTNTGTLIAVLWYFRHDLVPLWKGFWHSVSKRELTQDGRLAWAVLLGTIPVGLAGIVFEKVVATQLRSPLVIAFTSIFFGLLLWAADYWGRRRRDEHSIGILDIVFIGIAQALALIPGTSRSGATMTAGLALGLDRRAAARFSFLLSIPVGVLAGGLEAVQLLEDHTPVDWTALGLGLVVSTISGYFCIRWLLAWLERRTMLPFVIYRVVLGIFLFYIFA